MNFRQDIFFPDLASKCRVRLIYYMVIGWLVNHMFSFHKYAAKRRTLTLWKTKKMRLVLELNTRRIGNFESSFLHNISKRHHTGIVWSLAQKESTGRECLATC